MGTPIRDPQGYGPFRMLNIMDRYTEMRNSLPRWELERLIERVKALDAVIAFLGFVNRIVNSENGNASLRTLIAYRNEIQGNINLRLATLCVGYLIHITRQR